MKDFLFVLLFISISQVASAAVTDYGKGVIKISDVSYGSDPLHSMDIYTSAEIRRDKKSPVILMVHGGAWKIGDKRAAAVVKNKMRRWVPVGFVFVSINYRLMPNADPFAQMKDVEKALAFAQSKAEVWGGDPDKFILMGHSSGGYLVALLASSYVQNNEKIRPLLGSVVLDSSPLDVVAMMNNNSRYRFLDGVFGNDADYWEKVSSFDNLSSEAKPILLVCSVWGRNCDQAKEFISKANFLGVRTSLLKQSLLHRNINQRLGVPGDYTRKVETFLSSLDGGVDRLLRNH